MNVDAGRRSTGVVSVEPGEAAHGYPQRPEHARDLRQPLPALPRAARACSSSAAWARSPRTCSSRRRGKQWRLAGADQVGFRHFVQPGDQMELTVQLKERSDDEATLSGEVKVDGKLVTRARRLRLVPAGA